MTDAPQVLLEHYLKQLRLPTMVREYGKLAEQCAKEGAAFEQFLLRLVELEIPDRERRSTERRIKLPARPQHQLSSRILKGCLKRWGIDASAC